MKILFIITQSEFGGAQRWVFDAATSLSKKDYEVAVASGRGSVIPAKAAIQKAATLDSRLRGNDNIEVITLRHLVRNINPIKDFLGLIEICRLIKKERPDVIQLCSAKAGLLGSIAARLLLLQTVVWSKSKINKMPKIIYRIGGWSFNDPRPQWQKKLFLWIEKLTAPLKDKIIVNSRHDYKQALRLKIAFKNKLILLYNGIKTTGEEYESFIKQNQAASAGRRFTVGAIANFYPTKGLTFLINAAALIKSPSRKPPQTTARDLSLRFRGNDSGAVNFKLTIVGDGLQRSLLEKLVKKRRLENTVKLAGQKSDPWECFKKEGGIDLFVIPSVKEGMPYVLLEAMARRLPIIAAAVGGIPEIIQNKKNGLLVPPANAEKLAAAIAALINNPDLREKLAKEARRQSKKFSLDKMVEKYIRIIADRR